jgi:hypothetical protein
MKTGAFLKVVALLTLVGVISCKQNFDEDNSGVLDVSAARSTGFAPGTHYALKSSIRRLVENIRMVNSGMEQGAYVYTVTNLNFSSFEHNTKGVTASLLLDLSVDASKGQAVTRRVNAGVNLTFHGQAKIFVTVTHSPMMVDVNYTGIQWTRPLTHRINTWTNARLLKGVIHKKAREQAMAAVPSTKAAIIQKVDQEIRNGIATQKAQFRQYFVEIARYMQDVPGAQPKLTSDRQGAYFQHHIKVDNAQAVKNPPNTPSDVDSGFLFHQETFTSLLKPNLAGKKIPIDDLGLAVCKSFSNSLFKLCSSEKKKSPIDIELNFDQDNPVNFAFQNNQIALDMNFSIKVASNDSTLASLKTFTGLGESAQLRLADASETTGTSIGSDASEPPATGVESDASETPGTAIEKADTPEETPRITHLTPKVNVKVVFNAENRRFARQPVIAEITSSAEDGGFLTRQPFYRKALVATLQKKIADAIPETISIPAAPTYATTNAAASRVGGALVIMKPEHFGIRDNWLFSYFTHCAQNNTQTSLGINMRGTKDSEGTPRLWVTNVIGSSPATKAKVAGFKAFEKDADVNVDYKPAAGLMKDDIIYSVDGQDQLVTAPELFSGSLAGKSLTANGVVRLKVGRQETLEGLDKPVWMMIEYDVQLRKVCRTAT